MIALLIIGASVYIATLPSKFEHTYNVSLNQIPKKALKNKLLKFENWKTWAITDTSLFKVEKNKDPLQSSLQNSLTNKQEFKLENEQISDSIIVQKLYTANQPIVQTLTWKLGKERFVKNLSLELKEELSFNDKLMDIFKWKNNKRSWLLHLHERLTYLKYTPVKQSTDYTVGQVKQNTFGSLHYIYITASGNINHLGEQTEEHIIRLEQFLDNQQLKSSGKPFTIYNNEPVNGNVIFSTALPINKAITINLSNAIRYAYLDTINVYEQEVEGNPENLQLLWRKFKQTQELTLTPMTHKKFVEYITPINSIDNTIKKQKLVWEKQPEIEIQEIDSIILDSVVKPQKRY